MCARSPLYSAPLLARVGDHFSRRQHSSHDGRVELVFSLVDVSGIIAHAKDKDGKISFFIEILMRKRHGQNSVEPVLAIGGLVAMLRSEERRVGKECRSRGWADY